MFMKNFRERTNTWPAFVDLFSNLVIILIFLLIVFVFLWTTTSVFNKNTGIKTIAELKETNAKQAEQIQQMTNNEQEAGRLLTLARAKIDAAEEKVSEKDLSIIDLITAYENRVTEMQAENDATKQELNNELVAQREFANTTAEKFAQMQEEMRVQRTQMQNEIADLKSANTAEIQKLTAALETAESKVRDQEVKYTEMSNRLNKALADKVAELKDASAYQSDFYRAIKIALGNSKAVQQDGDRFIISSDILFPSGSYKLSPEGKTQLQLISNVIKDFETKIPSDVNWIIRVDGHTDNKPVIRGTRAYRNNMQLSLLRATAVADELARDGVSRNRLIPTGFGDMDPISTGTTPTDLQKNRRIELQLTNR